MKASPAVALIDRCNLNNILGQPEAAFADCRHALALNPNSARAHEALGWIYLKQNQHTQAAAEFDQALKANGYLALALYGRGLLKRQAGDEIGATRDLTQATHLRRTLAREVDSFGLATSATN